MQFVLTINANSAAFTHVTNDERNGEPNPGAGVADVLRRLADKVEDMGDAVIQRDQGDPFVLMDVNGVRVGTAHFVEEDVRGCSCGMADYGAPGHDGHEEG